VNKKTNKRIIQQGSSVSEYNLRIEELRKELAKGWDGPVSKRSVKDIIDAKINYSV
jgi:hypothetical protein